MSTVLSFAEESCWDGERFRSVRRPIVFAMSVTFPGKGTILHEFESDYGVFYDVEDDWLIAKLQDELPDVDWGWLIYHKKVDHSAIDVHHPDTGVVLGRIYPRGTKRQSSKDLPEGVVSLAAWRAKNEQSSESESSPGG